MDLNGKNDPYVKLTLGKQSGATRVQLKTNDPVWNEHFVFGVNSVDAQQLQLSVMDHDRFKLDDHIGSCTVGLSHLPISEAAAVGDESEDDPMRHCLSLDGRNTSQSIGEKVSGEWECDGDDADTATDTETLVSSVCGWRSGTGSSGDAVGGLSDHELDSGDWSSSSGSDSQEAEDVRGGMARLRVVARPRLSKMGRKVRSLGEIGRTEKKKRSTGGLPPRKGGRRTRGDAVALEDKTQDEMEGKHLTYYRLLTTDEKRLAMSGSGGASLDRQHATAGELACDIWLTSFQPRPLPIQGESKFTLRCRVWEVCGVTSHEERVLPVSGSTKHRVVLMTGEDRVSSKSLERSKDEEKKTSFHGSVISLDFRANIATDMLKFVVQQNLAPVEITYKSVATVSIPLRSIPISFPEGDGEPSARQYRLQTLAGLMTTRTMDNGFVVMSLTLVPSGNDLLGEPEPDDSEDVKTPPPPSPPALAFQALDATLSCGYQRLRKALLWNDSKLQAAWHERLNNSEVTYSPWVNNDDSPGQEDLTDCKRERTFVIPKSSMVAATRTEASDEVVLDGPSRMVFETRNRTPGAPYGDKFLVAEQFVLTKLGPGRCRLETSAEAVFSEKIMGFVQGKIMTAVTKVTKENHAHMLALIEEVISGNGPGAGSAAQRGLQKVKAVGGLLRVSLKPSNEAL